MLEEHKILKRNNVQLVGSGSRVMMFAHGFGCDQHMWRYITPAFEKDYKIVLFDYVGAGKSDLAAYNPERYETLNGYALDILEICEVLDLKQAIFVGHSVSAMIGLLASLSQPEYFSKLIMVGPSPYYLNEGEYQGGFDRADIDELLTTMEKNYIGWSNFLAPQIMGNPDRAELGEELTDSFCSTDPVIARQFAKATFLSDNREDLAKSSLPILLMQCSQDIIAPQQVGNYLLKHLPNSTLSQMEATGHCPHLSAPDETISVMKKFLASHQ